MKEKETKKMMRTMTTENKIIPSLACYRVNKEGPAGRRFYYDIIFLAIRRL